MIPGHCRPLCVRAPRVQGPRIPRTRVPTAADGTGRSGYADRPPSFLAADLAFQTVSSPSTPLRAMDLRSTFILCRVQLREGGTTTLWSSIQRATIERGGRAAGQRVVGCGRRGAPRCGRGCGRWANSPDQALPVADRKHGPRDRGINQDKTAFVPFSPVFPIQDRRFLRAAVAYIAEVSSDVREGRLSESPKLISVRKAYVFLAK